MRSGRKGLTASPGSPRPRSPCTRTGAGCSRAGRPDATPVQLLTREGPTLWLWDAHGQRKISEGRFALPPVSGGPAPAGLQVRALTLASDASLFAAAAQAELAAEGFVAVWRATGE